VERFALQPGAVVADLGAGTGLSARPFLRAGLQVIAVEPDPRMLVHARESTDPPTRCVEASAERTGLADGSVDLVVAAQAFHWFDVPATRQEALRILRGRAPAAVVWNDRRGDGSAFARGYEDLLRRFGPEYLEIRHRHGRVDRVQEFFGGPAWQEITVAHAEVLDLDRLRARLESASYVPAAGAPGHEAMIEALQALFDATAQDGCVTMEYDTRALVGELQA
jgi:SAM-dependent methyltransferase